MKFILLFTLFCEVKALNQIIKLTIPEDHSFVVQIRESWSSISNHTQRAARFVLELPKCDKGKKDSLIEINLGVPFYIGLDDGLNGNSVFKSDFVSYEGRSTVSVSSFGDEGLYRCVLPLDISYGHFEDKGVLTFHDDKMTFFALPRQKVVSSQGNLHSRQIFFVSFKSSEHMQEYLIENTNLKTYHNGKEVKKTKYQIHPLPLYQSYEIEKPEFDKSLKFTFKTEAFDDSLITDTILPKN